MTIETTFTGAPGFVLEMQGLVVETEMAAAIPGKPGPGPYEEWLSRGHTGSYEDYLAVVHGGGSGAFISDSAPNQMKRGEDGGLLVPDEYESDLLALYILNARG